MDIYESVLDLVSNLTAIGSWDEFQSSLNRAAARRPVDWQLPLLGCEAVGGQNDQAVPAAAAVACLQISIILIDDLLDGDPRGEYHAIGMPATANLASAFQAAGLEVLEHSKATPEVRLSVARTLNQMILATAFGQNFDTQNLTDEVSYWRLIRTKSSPFFGAALCAGALLGGAPGDIAERIKQFGHLYGEIIQIHDDLHDTMAVPANPDWLLGRSPLPILYAQGVDYPEKLQFLELRRQVSDPIALSEAQNILIRCGAVSYCVDQIIRRHSEAEQILSDTPLVQREGLENLLSGTIDPVQNMFAAVRERQP